MFVSLSVIEWMVCGLIGWMCVWTCVKVICEIDFPIKQLNKNDPNDALSLFYNNIIPPYNIYTFLWTINLRKTSAVSESKRLLFLAVIRVDSFISGSDWDPDLWKKKKTKFWKKKKFDIPTQKYDTLASIQLITWLHKNSLVSS
jgi:hypothetical protein